MGCDWNCSGLVTVISQHSPMEPTPRLDMSVHMQSKPPLMLAVLRPLMSLAQQSSYYTQQGCPWDQSTCLPSCPCFSPGRCPWWERLKKASI
ncbi:uncharacterized protein LOC141581653 isoform X4 [Saimiri boliviensis]|uniref:uncharacterized protein LOC141581653 isoform X4 n=1 Tax=Saimiri boliviensis TaxID=27679 RepID=UPI003D77FC1B